MPGKINKPSILVFVTIALAGFNACATGLPRKNSVEVGAAPDAPASHASGKTIQITDSSYEQDVVQSQIPVLIMFWAPWSAPDRIMMPTIEAVANKYGGRVKVGKVNVDENAELAEKFGIKGIPTVIVIKNGSERERVVGVTSNEAIGRMLDKQLENNP